MSETLSPCDILREAVNPALTLLEGLRIGPPGGAARTMLIAIGLQESALRHRAQVLAGGGKGPARGLWQFERGGGVAGVLRHVATRAAAAATCRARGVAAEANAVWAALETDDILACAFARLLLWTDPRALPPPRASNGQAAWQYYLRNWRPGKPHPERWGANWSAALVINGEHA